MMPNPSKYSLKAAIVFFMVCLIAEMASAEDALSSSFSEQNNGNRFVQSKDGIVLDTRTRLEWVVGPDRDTAFRSAAYWADNLSIAGGGWRLPTRAELRSLYLKKSRFSFTMPPWVTFPASGIWSGHIRRRMIGDTTYYHYYRDGVEFTTTSAETFFDMRSLAVRRKGARDDTDGER